MLSYYRFLFLFCCFPILSNAQSSCLTQLMDDEKVQENQRVITQEVRQWIDNRSMVAERSIATIPIVIHIVWHENEENISDEQIASQLSVLNNSFQGNSANLAIVPTIFQDLIADTEIEFCLAQRTPTNQPTNGIERIRIAEPAIVSDRTALFAASPLWNPAEYLNIYVVNLAPSVDGEATFPAEATLENDAIRMNYRSFGTIETATINPARSGGKSLVHEVGHYLGLRHIWGREEGCTFDDFDGMDDTPLQSQSYLGQCPSSSQSSCGTPDMYMNFMDYTDDDCLAMFTPDQKMWMLGVLNTTRSGLLGSRGCDSVVSSEQWLELSELKFWYDAASQVVNFQFADNQKFVILELFDAIGRKIAVETFVQQKNMQWQLAPQTAGIYYLHLRTDSGEKTYPLFFSDRF
ncbi:MAG: zinc-dependent metalloprotease [Saprospiraceae bacterium]